jgi:hypothetical protein
MVSSLASIALGFSLLISVADSVPNFDVGPSCRGGAASGAAMRKDVQGCINEEHEARDKLRGEWSGFPAADRARCSSMTNTGGPPSYIELVTCLELARDARKIPDEEKLKGPADRITPAAREPRK